MIIKRKILILIELEPRIKYGKIGPNQSSFRRILSCEAEMRSQVHT